MLCVVLMTPLSGCGVGNPGYNGEVVFRGDLGVEDAEFVMDGKIVNGGMENFSDVDVSLYYANGTAFHSTNVGALNREIQITLRSTTIPEHVIIHSPDFWNTSRVQVNYYTRNESGGYMSKTISQRSGLPVELG